MDKTINRLLLCLSFISFSFTFANTNDDIGGQYYHSMKKRDFEAAQKILETCKKDKYCDHYKLMNVAFGLANADKDVSTAHCIYNNEFSQKMSERKPILTILFAISVVSMVGSLIQQYRERY